VLAAGVRLTGKGFAAPGTYAQGGCTTVPPANGGAPATNHSPQVSVGERLERA
jgi:hypothetical protein